MTLQSRKPPVWRATRASLGRAQALRRDSTDAENIVWSGLRAHRLNGASFRRQVPVGPYIVDFLCHAARLIVEIDGGQHFEPEQLKRDDRCTAILQSKGFGVLRFNNYDVMTNRSGVFEMIATAVEPAPSPTLPRKRGRERSNASGGTK